MVLLMKSSTIDLVLIKFVQDRSQNNSQCCINKRLYIRQKNSDRYEKVGDVFLDRIIAGDETWVHHYKPELKWQSMDWKHPQSSIRKKVKSQPTAGKLMLTVFLDSQGPILEHYQERGPTINSARYSEMLIGRLKPEI